MDAKTVVTTRCSCRVETRGSRRAMVGSLSSPTARTASVGISSVAAMAMGSGAAFTAASASARSRAEVKRASARLDMARATMASSSGAMPLIMVERRGGSSRTIFASRA
jgi:hypothetical protein